MNQKTLNRKLQITLIIMTLMLLAITARLAYIQLHMGEKYKKISNINIIRTTYLPAPRGEIRDRNGRILAYDSPRLNVCAVISEIGDVDQFAKTLSAYIDYTPERIIKIIKKNKHDIYGKTIIKPRVNKTTMMHLAEIQPDLPGLYLEVQPVRIYPMGCTASHIIGYVGETTEEELEKLKEKDLLPNDFIGKDGIEKQYDKLLRGKHGEIQELSDASGRVIKKVRENKPKPGKNIYLSLDAELQKQVEEILQWHVDSLSSISGEKLAASAVIMDVKTGEILTMASIPQFDPNKFLKGLTEKEYKEIIERRDYPLLNRSIAGEYPLASTFKLITAAAALQEGLCTRHSPFNCPGYYMVGKQRFNCFVTTGHHKIDFNESMSESCDVVYYIFGEKLGIDKLLKYCRDFGLGHKTYIDLPGESPGLLPDHYWKVKNIKEPWYTGDTINLSIGQGYLGATPLQLAVVTATVATDGVMYKPHLLIKEHTPDTDQIRIVEPEITRKLNIEKDHFDAIKYGMLTAVKKGTAKRLKPPMTAAGKTGTAESFPNPENPRGRNHTWFCGFAPYSEPEIVIVVFFEKSGGYAGEVVVPIAGEILQAYHTINTIRAQRSRQ